MSGFLINLPRLGWDGWGLKNPRQGEYEKDPWFFHHSPRFFWSEKKHHSCFLICCLMLTSWQKTSQLNMSNNLYVLGSKLPLFPCKRGWETQPNSRGKDSLLKVGWVYPQYRELMDPGTYARKKSLIPAAFHQELAWRASLRGWNGWNCRGVR